MILPVVRVTLGLRYLSEKGFLNILYFKYGNYQMNNVSNVFYEKHKIVMNYEYIQMMKYTLVI